VRHEERRRDAQIAAIEARRRAAAEAVRQRLEQSLRKWNIVVFNPRYRTEDADETPEYLYDDRGVQYGTLEQARANYASVVSHMKAEGILDAARHKLYAVQFGEDGQQIVAGPIELRPPLAPGEAGGNLRDAFNATRNGDGDGGDDGDEDESFGSIPSLIETSPGNYSWLVDELIDYDDRNGNEDESDANSMSVSEEETNYAAVPVTPIAQRRRDQLMPQLTRGSTPDSARRR